MKSVRDFIHREFGTWLEIETKAPEEGASAREWSDYRAKVKQAVEDNRKR